MFLPCEDNHLRNSTINRSVKNAEMTEEIDGCLFEVLERELDLIRIQDSHRKELEAED